MVVVVTNDECDAESDEAESDQLCAITPPKTSSIRRVCPVQNVGRGYGHVCHPFVETGMGGMHPLLAAFSSKYAE